MDRSHGVSTIPLRKPRAGSVIDAGINLVPSLSSRGEPPNLLTPSSDYGSDALMKSQTSTSSSVRIPMLEINDVIVAPIRATGLKVLSQSRSSGALPAMEDIDSTPEPDAEADYSLRSLKPKGNVESEADASLPRKVQRLKAKAPKVAINDQGEVEKLHLFDDSGSTCKSLRSLNSSKANVNVDRRHSIGCSPGVMLTTDPFWQIRMRNIEPPKHPRLKKAGHYCRKVVTFVFSHVGLFLVVMSYTAIGGFIFPLLENERALGIRQELHEQTRNLSELLLQEVWSIGMELVTADEYLLEDSMIAICNHILHEGPNSAQSSFIYETQLEHLRLLVEDVAKKREEEDGKQHQAESDCADRRRRSVDRPYSFSDPSASASGSASASASGINQVLQKFELFAIIWKARNRHRFQERIDNLVNEFRKQVYQQTINGWDGRDTFSHDTQWTFVGALLYTITVITTIGYGHMVPRTFEGRVVTIIYSLIGIPLTLLCVANMGSLFASTFRLSYLYVSELICGEFSLYNKWKAERERRREQEAKAGANRDCSYICRWIRRLRLFHRSSSVGRAFLGIRAKQILGNADIDSKSEQRSVLAVIRKEGQRARRKQKIRVPVSVTLVAISCYLLLGALLFSSTESWEFFDAFYFCYITLSTIGFGDFVPGTSLKEDDSQGQLALCGLYLICGLGMMSMTIQLMQDEVRLKVKRIAQHIGLVKAPRVSKTTPFH